jgi:hypothetical protein
MRRFTLSRIIRSVSALAVAATFLTALSVAPAQAQGRGRYYRPRVVAQPYGYYDPYYDEDGPFRRRSSKTKDVFTVVGPAAGGAVAGGMFAGKKGAIIGAAIGAGIGTAIVVKRHRDRDRFRFPF